MNHRTHPALRAALAFVTAAAALVPAAPASAIGFDFEDGTLQGWLPTQTGGTGATGVEVHLGSLMAFATHTGPFVDALSYDFAFVADSLLDFDMHATSVAGGFGTPGYAGVTISFLNGLNVALGSVSLINTTSPSTLGNNEFFVDALPHRYQGTMAAFAAEAGLASTASVAKMSVSFSAYGTTILGGPSVSTVWFDNVVVGVVPEPDAWPLLSVGLALVGVTAMRRRRDSADDDGLTMRG